MSDNNNDSIAAELLSVGKALGAPISVSGYKPSVIIPNGFELRSLDLKPDDPLPDHIKQRVILVDTKSFIDYIKRYQTIQTVLFATPPQTLGDGAQFKAIFDYHAGGKGNEHAPARCAHVATYPIPLSLQWKTWLAINGKAQSQQDFIDHIDRNTPDITSPDSAKLLELAMNFESKTEVQFSTKLDRITGGRLLNYSETVDASQTGGKIQVPEFLTLRLPVFEGEALFEIKARLEWKPSGGKLSVIIRLQRPEDLVLQALGKLRSEIAESTELAPLTGHLG